MRHSTTVALLALAVCAFLAGCSDGDSVTGAGKGQLRIALDSTAGSTTAADFSRTLEGALPASPIESLGEGDDDPDDRNPGDDDDRPRLSSAGAGRPSVTWFTSRSQSLRIRSPASGPFSGTAADFRGTRA